VNVNKLIDDTFSTIQVPANVKVSRETDKNFPELLVDPELMRRALANLIRNAIQAMSDGGKLTVRASRTNETVLIGIQDTGAGIAQENLDKIWSQPFTTKAGGTGIGLVICKKLIEAHGGTIIVGSEVGKGSIFTVKLPLKVVS
jgi:signal transduction histidine kinase